MTMHVTRTALATAVIVMAFGAWGGIGSAQEEPDPMAPAFFTFTSEPVEESSVLDGMVVRDRVVRDHRPVQIVEATDARASGLLTSNVNLDFVQLPDGAVMTAAGSERLTNDDGSWVGTGRFVTVGGEDGGLTASMDVLTGEGGYVGLTLIVGQFASEETATTWGVIVPTDQLPPMPEPFEPSVG